jgi:propanol-preferring alcohol dehydrogenase
MRAMVLHSPASIDENPLRLEEIDRPQPGPHDVLLQVEVCAVCRTDLHVVEGELPPEKSPVVPGHQVVGRVVELGSEVSTVRLGERRGIAWLRHVDGTC